eukprot:TRINITY_DN6654_c0_g1_i1.p1 TRINITY_DN6654_c0_g1~~TRINITY_DN6654_c0_g1_i1.p1  ORF type:complete len:326 (+),score=93.95 TRINITY_DN6654_c0_g1_i1:2-979(+)
MSVPNKQSWLKITVLGTLVIGSLILLFGTVQILRFPDHSHQHVHRSGDFHSTDNLVDIPIDVVRPDINNHNHNNGPPEQRGGRPIVTNFSQISNDGNSESINDTYECLKELRPAQEKFHAARNKRKLDSKMVDAKMELVYLDNEDYKLPGAPDIVLNDLESIAGLKLVDPAVLYASECTLVSYDFIEPLKGCKHVVVQPGDGAVKAIVSPQDRSQVMLLSVKIDSSAFLRSLLKQLIEAGPGAQYAVVSFKITTSELRQDKDLMKTMFYSADELDWRLYRADNANGEYEWMSGREQFRVHATRSCPSELVEHWEPLYHSWKHWGF